MYKDGSTIKEMNRFSNMVRPDSNIYDKIDQRHVHRLFACASNKNVRPY